MLYIHAAYQCFLTMSPRCMSTLHIHAAWTCCMNMVLENVVITLTLSLRHATIVAFLFKALLEASVTS
jgi:hypothetical protein